MKIILYNSEYDRKKYRSSNADLTRIYNEIDLCPSLSLLLGLNIPKHNEGTFIQSFFDIQQIN